MARGEVGKRRREEIIEAAVAISAEQGLQHLSLSAIEERAGLSRGQLTYYFPTKEDILLAVFDRLIEMMRRRAQAGECPTGCQLPSGGWERVRAFLSFFLTQQPPPEAANFHALQYTFLSQMSHRDDFRQRLATLYEDWRQHMAGDLESALAATSLDVSPRTLASFIQALLHGLAMQRVADPEAFDRGEMARLCLHLLDMFLGKPN